MRKSVRTLAATALAIPMTLGAAGMAFADDTVDIDRNQTAGAEATSEQGATTEQANDNTAPVTQLNPAVNVSDVLGLSDFANEDSDTGSDQSIVQDNSVNSSNDQGNKAGTDQAQKTIVDQLTSLAG